MTLSPSESPSPRAVLLLASIAGAFWLVGVAALCLTPLIALNQHAHVPQTGVAIGLAVFIVVTLGVASALSIVASSRLRRLLEIVRHAA
jgi:hypothetical protein